MVLVVCIFAGVTAVSANSTPLPATSVNGVFPDLTIYAPAAGSDSETGIGALIPWADRLWAVAYVAHMKGEGVGLYEISADMTMHLHPESVTGTFANRLIHWETQQAVIGPHVIDAVGNVRTIQALVRHRLTSTARHLEHPETMVYFLTMEGLLFETDLKTLETRQVSDVTGALKIEGQPHFKGCHTAQGRVVVANNTYEEEEFLGTRSSGCLAEWDGKNWTVIEKNPFVEVSGKQNPVAGSRYGNTLYATGWCKASAILRVLHEGKWTRYLLPKASQAYDHTWNTEWMRIREAQTERYLMDLHGLFYELPPLVYGGHVWGIRPICAHLRIVPDFCHWRGMFVMASDQTDNAVGQPQSGLWFGNIDDLWNMGKSTGWGGPWWDTDIPPDAPSDPFLMTGFDKKVLHLTQIGPEETDMVVEVDFRGDGNWSTYTTLAVPNGGYVHHEFPEGFSAHWVRLRSSRACRATAQFVYS